MQRLNVIGYSMWSAMILTLVAAAPCAADSAGRDADAASGNLQRTTLDITCNDPGFEKQGTPQLDLTTLMGPEVDADLRRRELRRLFTTAEHYRVRDGLTDYE